MNINIGPNRSPIAELRPAWRLCMTPTIRLSPARVDASWICIFNDIGTRYRVVRDPIAPSACPFGRLVGPHQRFSRRRCRRLPGLADRPGLHLAHLTTKLAGRLMPGPMPGARPGLSRRPGYPTCIARGDWPLDLSTDGLHVFMASQAGEAAKLPPTLRVIM